MQPVGYWPARGGTVAPAEGAAPRLVLPEGGLVVVPHLQPMGHWRARAGQAAQSRRPGTLWARSSPTSTRLTTSRRSSISFPILTDRRPLAARCLCQRQILCRAVRAVRRTRFSLLRAHVLIRLLLRSVVLGPRSFLHLASQWRCPLSATLEYFMCRSPGDACPFLFSNPLRLHGLALRDTHALAHVPLAPSVL